MIEIPKPDIILIIFTFVIILGIGICVESLVKPPEVIVYPVVIEQVDDALSQQLIDQLLDLIERVEALESIKDE